MTNNDRIARLHAESDTIDQVLMDLDPDGDRYWELVAQAQAISKTLALLQAPAEDTSRMPTYDARLDPCSLDFDPDSWNEA